MKSTDNRVEHQINKAKPGSILFVEDFIDLGSNGAVHNALYRLVKSKKISRLARGIYAKHEYSKLLDTYTLPSTEKVAIAIAKRDKATLLPTGVSALNILGLSTQVPLKLVYLTDGSPRTIKIGKRTIYFKRTTPKNLKLKEGISQLVVQALKEIGKDKATSEELDKIYKLLQKEEKQKLKHNIGLAPRWIAEIMTKAL